MTDLSTLQKVWDIRARYVDILPSFYQISKTIVQREMLVSHNILRDLSVRYIFWLRSLNENNKIISEKGHIFFDDYTGWVKKKSPLTKYDSIAPNIEKNEICFWDIDPIVHVYSRYKNSIDRSRNVSVMSAWKWRTSFDPTQGLHFSSLWNVLPDMSFHCFDEIWIWKIWKILSWTHNCLVVIIHIFHS